MKEKKFPEFALILAFDVKVAAEALAFLEVCKGQKLKPIVSSTSCRRCVIISVIRIVIIVVITIVVLGLLCFQLLDPTLQQAMKEAKHLGVQIFTADVSCPA
eukprot:1717358-Amphidinium_carterae.2